MLTRVYKNNTMCFMHMLFVRPWVRDMHPLNCVYIIHFHVALFPPLQNCNSTVLWITPWSSSFWGITDRKCGKTSSESTVRSGFAAAMMVYTDMGWRLCPTLRDSRLGHCTAMLTISSPTVSVFLAGGYICFILIINPSAERSQGTKNATLFISKDLLNRALFDHDVKAVLWKFWGFLIS